MLYAPGIKQILGYCSNNIVYPIFEKIEKRHISKHLKDIVAFRNLSADEREAQTHQRLMRILHFSSQEVPYYRDLFNRHKINLEKIDKDPDYLQDIPILDKETIRQEGHRMLGRPLDQGKFHECKTSGSTGPSLSVFYNNHAADRSAAVTKFCRMLAGKRYHRSELHFACDFNEVAQHKWCSRETLKSAAMNRSNIFFSSLTPNDLSHMVATIQHRRPYLVHGHPSTMFLIAAHVAEQNIDTKLFDVFEPSGELLSEHMRHFIHGVLGCRIHNRYGLAEFGIVAYQEDSDSDLLRVFDSDFKVETSTNSSGSELLVTGLHNFMMPLIRYNTGDLGNVLTLGGDAYIANLTGRIHDQIEIGGKRYLTHHLQDILQHRVGGILEFQILVGDQIQLHISPDGLVPFEEIYRRISTFFGNDVLVKKVEPSEFLRTGPNQKFRHIAYQND